MLGKLFQRLRTPPAVRSGARRRPRCRPAPEVLEGRLAPAVLTVDSLADNTTADSVLTLREAVALVDGTLGRSLTAAEQAQVSGTLGSNDTIKFSLPSGPQTITLTQGALAITSPVTIAGPGAGNLTVNGGGSDRVFVVGQIFSQSLGLNVAISGLTITGGSAAYGGGLLSFGTLALSNDVISNNAATADGGGGVYNDGALTLTGCTLTGNTTQGSSSTAGGGLDNTRAGTVTAVNCTFSGNAAGGSGAAASSGGGAANSGAMTLTGCTFSSNSAASNGGALYSDGVLTIGATTFSNNSAGSDGGAIRSGGSLTAAASTFGGNTAASVGGALDTSDATAALTNCTLAGNIAGSRAGAIEADSTGGPLTLTNVTVSANWVAGSSAGGLSADRPVTLYNTLVAGNFQGAPGGPASDVTGTLDPGSSYDLIGTGGAGGLSNGVNHNQVGVGNPALSALASNGGPTPTVILLPGSPALAAGNAAYVTAGETDQRGLPRVVNGAVDIGAVEVQPTDIITPAFLTVNSLADNTAADSVLTLREAIELVDGTLGRPLTAAEQAQVTGTLGFNDTIQFSLPSGPQTITLTQGALDVTSPVTIAGTGAGNLTINGKGGGRVFVVGQIFTQSLGLVVAISGLTVTGGSAAYGAGLLNFGTLALSNDVISHNTATANGGGGVYNDGALTLSNCSFIANTTQGTSPTAGGGLENIIAGTVTAVNCTFSGNTAGGSGAAASSGGGAANSGTMTLTGCTFSSNSCASDGGAIYSDGALTIGTTTFSANSAGSDGGAIRSGGSSLTVTASTFSGNTVSSVGGAIDTTDATAVLTNCTFSGNTAGSLGGAIEAESTGGPVTLTNVTVTANRVKNGSGGRFGGGLSAERRMTLDNTLVAGNFQGATGSTANDVSGTLDPGSSNDLIGTGGAGGLSNGVNHNLLGVSNPGLAALASNGGPTQTVMLLPGSPALAAGGTAFVTAGETDQRGLPRVVNGAVDIGAVEVQVTATAPADQNSQVGSSTSFTLGSFADANLAVNLWTVDVNWGDGSAHTVFTTQSRGSLGKRAHTYRTTGTFTVVVTVTDSNHDASRITFRVHVTTQLRLLVKL